MNTGDSKVEDTKDNTTEDGRRLVYVHAFLRHGDRTPIKLVNKDNIEAKLWIPTLSHYSHLDTDKNSMQFTTKNKNIKLEDVFSWTNIASKLSQCFPVNSNTKIEKKEKENENKVNMNDIYTKDAEAYKYEWCGQLTKKGVIESNEFGKYLKNKYAVYLSQATLHCHSTNYARTLQTMDSILYGLQYKNKKIPIYTDIQGSYFRFPSSKICPKFKVQSQENELYVSQTLKLDEKYIKLKENILASYGRSVDDIHWNYLAALLICRLAHDIDLPSPDIATQTQLENYINFTFMRAMTIFSLNREIIKLSSGVLLNKLINQMKNEKNKFVLVSAHDETLLLVLIALTNGKKVEFNWPVYLASVVIEVWEQQCGDEQIKRYVKVFYDKKIMKINDKEWVGVDEFEDMWKDLICDEKEYVDVVCKCNQ